MQRQRLVTRACIEDRTAAREAHEVGRDERRDDRLAKARRALRDAAIRARDGIAREENARRARIEQPLHDDRNRDLPARARAGLR